MDLRYGINPNQTARVTPIGESLPFRVLAGTPSYVNVLDALNSWQLVRSLRAVVGRSAATSFKHVSPAGAAVSGRIDETMADTWGVPIDAGGSLSSAYVRARDADPKSSYGDFVAVSDPVDSELAELLRGTINDGIIAPGFEPGVMKVLREKKQGTMLVLEIDPKADPPPQEIRDLFGVRLEQDYPGDEIHRDMPEFLSMSEPELVDALVGMVTVRYTQSNAVGFVRDGMMIGIGAGQQSRVDCTRLAGGKVDVWWLRRHPAIRKVAFSEGLRRQERLNALVRLLEGDLTPFEADMIGKAMQGAVPALSPDERHFWLSKLAGVTFVSDALVTFRDNVDHASRRGIHSFLEPGGSAQSSVIESACAEFGIKHVQTGVRLFHH